MNRSSGFQNDFFNDLINNYGFFVEEIGEGDNSLWMAVKTVNNGGLYSVIISKENEEEKNKARAKEHLESKGVPYSLHNMILSKSVESNYDSNDFNLDTSYHRVIIDVINKKVVSYDKNSEPLAKISGNLFNKISEPKKPWYKRMKSGKTTTALIAVNVIIFIASVVVAGLLTGRFLDNIVEINNGVLYILGAKDNTAILRYGQYYRLLTSMFLHGGIIHLAFNMYALYALGDTIESIYGRTKYLIIYFVSGIVASIFSLICSPYMGVGASGAIFGLLGAALIFALHEKHKIGKQFLTNVIVVIVANILIGLSMPNIDNFAHIGGLIGGIIISFFLYRYDFVKRVNQ